MSPTKAKSYLQEKPSENPLTSSKPNVLTYAGFKIVDNALVVFIAFLVVGFSIAGAFLDCNNYKSSSWFLDIAKVCLGVLLGLISPGRRK